MALGLREFTIAVWTSTRPWGLPLYTQKSVSVTWQTRLEFVAKESNLTLTQRCSGAFVSSGGFLSRNWNEQTSKYMFFKEEISWMKHSHSLAFLLAVWSLCWHCLPLCGAVKASGAGWAEGPHEDCFPSYGQKAAFEERCFVFSHCDWSRSQHSSPHYTSYIFIYAAAYLLPFSFGPEITLIFSSFSNSYGSLLVLAKE